MDNKDFHTLYTSTLQKVKASGQNQYVALCPFHEDRNPSFSFNADNGLYCCHSGNCGVSGNAYQYAMDVGANNPKQYIVDDENTSSTTLTTKVVQNAHNTPKKETPVNRDMLVEYYTNLQGKWDELDYKYIWDIDVIKGLGIGIDKDNVLHYAYHNTKGDIISIKKHRGFSTGDTSVKWYLRHKIATYSKDKDLFICEGEKDALVLLSKGYQVITSSNGSKSIPYHLDNDGNKILELECLRGWSRIILVFDKDKAGDVGADKIGQEILKEDKNLNVIKAQWEEGLKDGYDVYDAFNDDVIRGKEFLNAIERAKKVEIRQENDINKPVSKGFNVINIEDYMEKEYQPIHHLVKDLIDEKGIAVFGGDTGSGKSWLGLQTLLSIASGTKLFDAFEVKQSKCLLVQFENNDFNQNERLAQMLPHFDNFHDWKHNLSLCELEVDNNVFIDNWANIEQTLINTGFTDGVLVVDNMYTSTDVDIHLNNELKTLLSTIKRISRTYNITILLICHTNKTNNNGGQNSIHFDQLQGGKTLINFVDNGMMIHPSSQNPSLRIAKIVKAGRVAENPLYQIPFKLHWDNDKCLFTKGVIIHNEAVHFLPPTERFEDKLIVDAVIGTQLEYDNYFTREQFSNNVSEEYIKDYKHPTQMTRLLKKLEKFGYIKQIAHNKYTIDLQVIKDIEERLNTKAKR